MECASTYTNLAPVCVVLLLVAVQQPRQAEVCDFDVIGRLYQHVPGRQVPVDQPPLLQVHHPLTKKDRNRGGGGVAVNPWAIHHFPSMMAAVCNH